MTDLLELTASLVDRSSVSRHEGPFVEWLEGELRSLDHLTVERVGDNLVARTDLGRAHRLILAGHTDTVPPADGPHGRNDRAVVDGDVLWGLGSTDMKGGLAVFLEIARRFPGPPVDLTFVFYAREEIAAVESGLGELVAARPELLQGDCAVLGEPTEGVIEAGCQGTMRIEIELAGRRSHTARPWKGRNAIHRLGPLLSAVADAEMRSPTLAGCTYREALQAVHVEGGVAGNVVPDRALVRLNHRFAPDHTPEEALEVVRAIVAPYLEEGDRFEVVDVAAGAEPGVDHPILADLAGRVGEVRAKLGWTDVARFAALGIPAVNLGPGDATVAHMADEHLHRSTLDRTWAALAGLLEA